MGTGSSPPFWGPIDALHQFCEAKYAVSPWVAEFWNAFSSILTFVVVGVYALVRGRGALDWRLANIWIALISVGVGSFLFHATMRFSCEVLDELPMLFLVFCGVVSKDDAHWMTSGSRRTLVHAVAASVCLGGSYLYISLGVYNIFLHVFTVIVLLDFAISLACAVRPDPYGSRVVGGLLAAYGLTLGSARLLWEMERRHCPAGRGGGLAWLHVAWHLLAAVACYLAVLADMHIRWAALGIGAAVDDPADPWPLVGLLPKALRRPASSHGKQA